MSIELSNSTANAASATFAPVNHLLGIVQNIVASRINTRIELSDKGEIVIFPTRNEYHANVQDMGGFCQEPASHYRVAAMDAADASYAAGSGRNVRDLLWHAAFHASQGRLVDGCSKYDVVKFNHWPNLTRLPVTPNAARICALLTRHPTTIMLVHRVLGIDKDEVSHIYSAAFSAGIAHVAHSMGRTPEVAVGMARIEAAENDVQAAPVHERSLFRSLFAKLSGL